MRAFDKSSKAGTVTLAPSKGGGVVALLFLLLPSSLEESSSSSRKAAKKPVDMEAKECCREDDQDRVVAMKKRRLVSRQRQKIEARRVTCEHISCELILRERNERLSSNDLTGSVVHFRLL